MAENSETTILEKTMRTPVNDTKLNEIIVAISTMSAEDLLEIEHVVICRRSELCTVVDREIVDALDVKLFERIRKHLVEQKLSGNNRDFSVYENFRDLISDEYFELPKLERWHRTNAGIPEYGDYPMCNSDDCWWSRHEDRLREYDGEYYMLVLDPSFGLCQVCYENDDDGDFEIDTINNLDTELACKFNEWNLEQSKKLRDSGAEDPLIINGKWIEYYMYVGDTMDDADIDAFVKESPQFCNLDTNEIHTNIQ